MENETTIWIQDPEFGWDTEEEDGEKLYAVPYVLCPSVDDPFDHRFEIETVLLAMANVTAFGGGIDLDRTADAIRESDPKVKREGFNRAKWYAIEGM